MHRSVFQRLGLCAPVTTEAPVTTSGATTTPPAAAATTTGEEKPAGEAEPPAPPASAAIAKPSLMDRAKALIKPASQIQAELTTAKSQIAVITGERDQLKTQVTSLLAERDGYKKQVTDFQALLDAAEGEKKTVQTEVIHQLAAAGMPEQSLPKGASSSATPTTIEDLQSAAELESDPVKKGKIASQLYNLRIKQSQKPELN